MICYCVASGWRSPGDRTNNWTLALVRHFNEEQSTEQNIYKYIYTALDTEDIIDTVDNINGDIHPLVQDHRISCYHFIVLNKFNFPDT